MLSFIKWTQIKDWVIQCFQLTIYVIVSATVVDTLLYHQKCLKIWHHQCFTQFYITPTINLTPSKNLVVSKQHSSHSLNFVFNSVALLICGIYFNYSVAFFTITLFNTAGGIKMNDQSYIYLGHAQLEPVLFIF